MKSKIAILLVEDDEVDVMAVKRAFKLNKITNPLYVVGDGEKALDFIHHRGEFADDQLPRPSLILLDLNMPRMGGQEFLRLLKSDPEFLDIPVVVLTSSDLPDDVKTSFRYGVAGYLVKPVTFENFAELIKALDMYWTISELP